MALNRRETIELARAIEERRSALIEEIHGDIARAREEPYAEIASATPDTGDEAVADLIADLDNAEATRDLTELREVEAARKRLADGTYGICADCGVDIDVERLRAQPAAARCVACQQRHEKTYRK